MEKRHYLLEYLWLWLKTFILYALGGVLIGGLVNNGAFDPQIGFFVAMIVFGFTFFDKVVPFNLFGNSDAVFVFWLIKIFLSCLLGVVAFPIVNIYYIIHIIKDLVHMFTGKKGE